jgi:beta-xylosidase
VNGPHQGAWVTTPAGEDWFLHFQDKGAYGRVVHLEPMHWKDGWPVMGTNVSAAGVGEPVTVYRKPLVAAKVAVETPPDSDEFDAPQLGLQWQWEANPQPGWAFPSQALGALRMIDVPAAGDEPNLWWVPNLLLQKFPADVFTTTAKVKVTSRFPGEETGLLVEGESYAYLGVKSGDGGLTLREVVRENASKDGAAAVYGSIAVSGDTFYLRAAVDATAKVVFSYSLDGVSFQAVGVPFQAVPGRWVGAKIGLFAVGPVGVTGERGYADYDWFRFGK